MWFGPFRPITPSGGPPGNLTITTASLPNAAVGQFYAQALTATGGTLPYKWNLVSATPNTGLALHPACGVVSTGNNGNIELTPIANEVITVTIQVNDAAGASAQKTLSLVCAAQGALSITTSPTLANATNGGAYFFYMNATGGFPPYNWTKTASTGSNTWNINTEGWLFGAPTVNSTDTVSLSVTDAAGSPAQTITVTIVTNSVLAVQGIANAFSVVNLPQGHANTKYKATLYAAGGTGTGYTWAVSGGALPTGLSLSPAGVITGTLGPIAGNPAAFSVSVTDSGSNAAIASCAMSILSQDHAARPSFNTGAGFYITTDGILRDLNGNAFRIRGVNQSTGAFGQVPNEQAVAQCACCRFFMFNVGTQGSPMSTFSAGAQNYINAGMAPIPVIATVPNAPPGSQITGSPNDSDLNACFTFWNNNESLWTTLQNNCLINVANEWQGTGNSVGANWGTTYAAGIPTMRTAGYLTTIVVDAGQGSSQDEQGFLNNYQTILNADTQKNLLFALHEYQYFTNIFAYISNIAGNTMTFNCNLPVHPLTWPVGQPAWAFPNSPLTNSFTGRGIIVQGVTGTMGNNINGVNVKLTAVGGTQGAWTATMATTFAGTYGGGGVVFDYDHIQQVSTRMQNLRSSGVRVAHLEFGSEAQTGLSGALPRWQRMTTLEAYQLDWNIWQMDGGDQLQLANNSINIIYTGIPSQLTIAGIESIWNPWYGMHALAIPPSSLL